MSLQMICDSLSFRHYCRPKGVNFLSAWSGLTTCRHSGESRNPFAGAGENTAAFHSPPMRGNSERKAKGVKMDSGFRRNDGEHSRLGESSRAGHLLYPRKKGLFQQRLKRGIFPSILAKHGDGHSLLRKSGPPGVTSHHDILGLRTYDSPAPCAIRNRSIIACIRRLRVYCGVGILQS